MGSKQSEYADWWKIRTTRVACLNRLWLPPSAERKAWEDFRRKVSELEVLPTEKDWGVFGEEELWQIQIDSSS